MLTTLSVVAMLVLLDVGVCRRVGVAQTKSASVFFHPQGVEVFANPPPSCSSSGSLSILRNSLRSESRRRCFLLAGQHRMDQRGRCEQSMSSVVFAVCRNGNVSASAGLYSQTPICAIFAMLSIVRAPIDGGRSNRL